MELFKLILICLMLSCFCSAQPLQPWTVHQAPVNALFQSLSYPDSMNAWAASDEGHIIHTSNGGINWILQSSPVFYSIYSIYFINNKTGWATASGGVVTGNSILKTTNGGINWNVTAYPDTNSFFYTIYFKDSFTGWMGGYEGRFAKTTDGGETWSSIMSDSSSVSYMPVNRLTMFNGSYGFACGGYYDFAGIVWRTTNSGLNWSPQAVSTEPLNDMIIFDSLHILMTGGDYELGAQIIQTSNGGADWEYIALNMFGIGRALSFRTPEEGWIVLGFSPHFCMTTNSGANWNFIMTADTSELYDIQFANSRNGIAVGKDGRVLRYDPDYIGITNFHESIPESITLYQNYPNPFNPITKIKFTFPLMNGVQKEDVRLDVYNSLGQLITSLLNKSEGSKLSPGTYEVEFNSENLPSGIYFYRLTYGLRTLSKKMILLK